MSTFSNNFVKPTPLTNAAVNLAPDNQLVRELEAQAGFFGRIGVRSEARRAAAPALSALYVAEVQAKAGLARKSIEIATAELDSAITAKAIERLGGLRVAMAVAGNTIDAAHTATTVATMVEIVNNRNENKQPILQMLAQRKVDVEDASVLLAQIDQMAANDLARATARGEDGKDRNRLLFETANAHISNLSERFAK